MERTNKFWKAQFLLSLVVVAVGGLMLANDVLLDEKAWTSAPGLFVLVGGAIWFGASQVGAWWNHG